MYLRVTFVVEAESEAHLMAELDEDAVAAALPGPGWLIEVEETEDERRQGQARMRVTFDVEAESEALFMAELDEGAVAAALPGPAWLISVEEKKTLSSMAKATWRKLRPP